MNDNLVDNLRAEYLALQAQYEGFDARVLTIKSWGTLLISGAIGVGLNEHSLAIFLVAIVASLCLWMLEAIWKSFQYCYTDRIKLIERWFREPHTEDLRPFQIFTAWGEVWDRHFSKPRALFDILKQPFVFIPYLPVILLSFVSGVWVLATELNCK